MANSEKKASLTLTESQLAAVLNALKLAAKGSKKKQLEVFGTEDALVVAEGLAQMVTEKLVSLQPLEIFYSALLQSSYGWESGANAYRAFLALGAEYGFSIAAGGYRFEVRELAGLMIAMVPNAEAGKHFPLYRRKDGQWVYFDTYDRGGMWRKLRMPKKLETVYDYLRWHILPSIEALEDAEDRRWKLYKEVAGWTSSCAICGRKLTDADSMTRGIGPECWDRMGGAAGGTIVVTPGGGNATP